MALRTIIAIDGPYGSGKTTVSRLLVKELGGTCLNIESFYAALAQRYISIKRSDNDITIEAYIERYLNFARIDLENGCVVRVDDCWLSFDRHDSNEYNLAFWGICQNAAAQRWVRTEILACTRRISPIVRDGRDPIHPFPLHAAKFYLTAPVIIRAKRMGTLRQNVRQRDASDASLITGRLLTRDHAVRAGYHVIDTSESSPEGVAEAILRIVRNRGQT